MKPKKLVSACLPGIKCVWDGADRYKNNKVIELLKKEDFAFFIEKNKREFRLDLCLIVFLMLLLSISLLFQ